MVKKFYLFIKSFLCNTQGGYMTLEATMLFPVIMMTLLFLLYTAFYRYDACLTKQDACLIAVAGQIPYKPKIAEQYVKNAMQDRYLEKYLSYKSTVQNQKTSKNSVQVRLGGKVVVPVGGSFFPSGKSRMSVEANLTMKRQNNLSLIRTYRKVQGIIKYVKNAETKAKNDTG